MAERIARVVREEPGRSLGFLIGLAALVAMGVALLLGVSLTSGAAAKVRSRHRPGAHTAALSQAQINANVNHLLGEMTVAEKFGQLELAGPATATGRPDPAGGEGRDRLGPRPHRRQEHQRGAAGGGQQLAAAHPADLRARRDPRLPDDVPGAAGRGRELGPGAGRERRVGLGRRGERRRDQVDVQPDGRHQPRPALGPRRRGRGRGPVPRLGDRRRQGPAATRARTSRAPDKVAATVKHFGGYGAPVAGREYNTVDMSTQQLFNDYLPPYKAAIDAGAATVMSSFNSLNGVPNTANPYMLHDDPARRVGLRRHHDQRLPGRPGARGLRLRLRRRARPRGWR